MKNRFLFDFVSKSCCMYKFRFAKIHKAMYDKHIARPVVNDFSLQHDYQSS